jgi:uncharacterized NAD-dependent epimerase/dehydratase family protein
MPTLENEIKLIESFSSTKVLAITLSHEDLTREETDNFINFYEKQLRLPATDVLSDGCNKLIEALKDNFQQRISIPHKNYFEVSARKAAWPVL